ncbi:MAG: hypothetical protein KC653_02160, partial [Candidatus Andersenbacteria bacterium]|nr:hypothetical protein [Candidatus Andersenbacteria bacterium]
MADELLSSTQTLTPTRTRSRTRAVVGTIAGLALFSGLAFALVRFGIQGDTYTVVENFEYTNEQLTAFESPLGDHDGSITATAEGQLVLATTPERPEQLAQLPFRENPDLATTRRLPFSRSDLDIHSICTDSERDIARGFRIGFDNEAIPQGGATTVLAEAEPIDNLGINNLRVRAGVGARAILHQVNWEVYGPGGDVAIQSAPIVEGVPFPRQVTFTSTDPSVAIVYPNGQILPISPGTTRIS